MMKPIFTLELLIASVLVSSAALAQTPGPPSGLTASLNADQTVTLQWTAPTTGGAPTGYVVEIGTSSGSSNTSSTTTGLTTTHTTETLQPDTYFLRVRAFNGSGVSTTSNEVTVNVACPDPAAAENLSWRPLPTNQVQVFWTKSFSEPSSQTTFTVEVGSAPGRSDVLVVPPESDETNVHVTMALAAGTHYVRIVGRNSCGTSASTSVEITVVSGQATGSSQVLVNEIGTRPSELAASMDFIELKNIGTTAVSIGGWKIFTGSFDSVSLATTVPTGTTIAPGCTFLLVRAGYGTDGDLQVNELFGTSAGLVDSTRRVRDSVAIDEDSDGGDSYPLVEGTRLQFRGSGAYARVADSDTNNNSADFVWLDTATPQNSNQCPGFVPPPTQLSAIVIGSAVTLMWTPPATTQPLTHYVVEVGITAGGNEFTPFNLPPGLSSITFVGAPNGTFYVRLRAATARGVSTTSNEVTIVVCAAGCTAPPGAPTQLTSQINGRNVMLTWGRPTVGAVPTGYVIEAGTATGLANLGQFPTGSTNEFVLISGVPPGTYFVRVRALNDSAMGAASNEVMIVVQ